MAGTPGVVFCPACSWTWQRPIADVVGGSPLPLTCAKCGGQTRARAFTRAEQGERNRIRANVHYWDHYDAKRKARESERCRACEAADAIREPDRDPLPDVVPGTEASWEQDPGSIFAGTMDAHDVMAPPEVLRASREDYDPSDRAGEWRVPRIPSAWEGLDMVAIGRRRAQAWTGQDKASLLREAAIRRWLLNRAQREVAA